MRNREVVGLSLLAVLMIVGGLLWMLIAYQKYRTMNEEGYVKVRNRLGGEIEVVGHSLFACPTVILLGGITVAYYAWRLHQDGQI